jgi:hypothetical protein
VRYIPVAIDAQHLLVGMLLVGNLDDPDLIQVHLLSSRDRLMATHTSLVHQVIAGRKTVGKAEGFRSMAVHAGDRCRMGPGGNPHPGNVLILMTGQAKDGIAGGKPHQSEAHDCGQDQDDGCDGSPGALGQFGYNYFFHDPPQKFSQILSLDLG